MACINNSNNSGRSAGRITAISLIPQRSAEGLSLRMLQGCHPSAAAAAMGLSSNTDRLADIQDIITEVLDLIGQDDSAIGSAATPHSSRRSIVAPTRSGGSDAAHPPRQ